jgi:excisionase family DNA binding protein
MTRLLTTRQVADLLAVNPETILRRWRRGEIPGYRIASNALRFDEAEIRAWLEGTRAAPRGTLVPIDGGGDRAG